MSDTQPSELSWADLLPEQSRSLLLFLLSHGALEPALRSASIVDVRLRGTSAPEPFLPGAITLDIAADDLDRAHRAFDRLGDGQRCILLRNLVQCLPDYRSFIGAAFDKLAIGGFLIVIVPHQFLYERKLQVPSRYNRAHLRFYTPGALLAEVEEALDPCRYRVRVLADNDSGFDYEASLPVMPAGSHDIVLGLEKIAPAPWREAMVGDESQTASYTQPHRFPAPYDGEGPAYQVITPDEGELRRLIVLKLDHRGDFAMAVPAFRALRQEFPDAAISLVCGSWNRQEAQGLGIFDRVVPFDFFPEDPSAAASLPVAELGERFAELMAGEPYDVAIDLRIYGETRGLLQAIDARHRAGFDPYDEFPWLTIPLNLLIPTLDGSAEQKVIPASGFHARNGDHQGFAIIFREGTVAPQDPMLIWGPYVALRRGHYEFEVLVKSRADAFELDYDLAADHGRRILATGAIRVERDRFPRLAFHALETKANVELRLNAQSREEVPPFEFMGLRYRRKGVYAGMHQREAMALLVRLVALRLEYPYRVTRE